MNAPGRSKLSGFSLIELLVTLTLIGLVAAVAYPSYAAYAARGRRADAQTVLLQAAQYMQRYYAAFGSYSGGGWVAGGSNTTGGPVPNRAPADAGQPKVYDVVATPSQDGRSFTLQAVPAAAGPMARDVCGSLTLSDTGLKGVTGSGATLSACWR
jgi:type IV pilus assembly protein PilE